jgi:heme oxygenase-like protein
LPARRISRGLTRLGFAPATVDYYEEHVEADAVHEQVAVRSICGVLIAEDPRLLRDVAFGAAACLRLDDLAAEVLLDRWSRHESALLPGPADVALSEV